MVVVQSGEELNKCVLQVVATTEASAQQSPGSLPQQGEERYIGFDVAY